MKQVKYLASAIFFSIALTALGQAGDKKEQELKAKQESERDRSLGGRKTESYDYRPDLKGKSTNDDATDTTNTENSPVNDDQGTKSSSGDNSNGLAEENNGSSVNEQKVNVAPVIERTSSESGSAAVPASKDREGMDGTNTVQRAKPNMAGAKEPGNMNLSDKNRGGKNINTDNNRVQRQEDVPHQPASDDKADERARPAQNGGAPTKKRAQSQNSQSTPNDNEVTSKSVDQQTASTEKEQGAKSKRKARRERRHNKD